MAQRRRKVRYPRMRPAGGFNPNGMVKTIGNVAIGAMGIGAITTLGIGALGAIKK